MIQLDDVSFWYHGSADATLSNVDLTIGEGEFALLIGVTGSGKSTLLGTLNGLVPHFTGGHLAGNVTVAGVSTRHRPPREFAHLIGKVGQDPLAGFVTDTVEEELAYGPEQFGVRPEVIRRRVEETLDLLGIAELRGRALRTLSGGQQQRVAIGSVLTLQPPVLVLDEPTSALDPGAAEDVLATLARLVEDLGTTVIVAEHRMERVIPFVETVVVIDGDGRVRSGAAADMMRDAPIAPPIVDLGRMLRLDPLPLTVRDARRQTSTVRESLVDHVPEPNPAPTASPVLRARGVVVRYGPKVAVAGVDFDLHPRTILGLMGRNGSGKSSLLWGIQGTGPRQAGTVQVEGKDPQSLKSANARRYVGLVPQTASDLLYCESVNDECATADTESQAATGTCRALLERIAPGIAGTLHPRDLSEGSRLALVLAVQLTAAPPVMLLDEPTRGLDYRAKEALGSILRTLAAEGRAIVVSTHDVEFVATIADEVAVMAQGEIISRGVTRDILGGSPAFAPQVAKILGPSWLTVSDVATALNDGHLRQDGLPREDHA